MGIADWLIILALLVSVVQAMIDGFFYEAFAIAGLVCGYLLAAWQYPRLASWLSPTLKNEWMADIAAFLVIFFGVMLVAAVIGRLARRLMKEVGLSAFDRLLGGVIGLLRGALAVSLVLVGMAAFTPTSKWLEGSEFAPYFLVVGRAAVWAAPAELRARFYQGLGFLQKAVHRGEQQKQPTQPQQKH